MINLSPYTEKAIDGYNSLLQNLPPHYAQLVTLFIFSLLIVVYALFTWKFSRSLAKRDLLELNLFQYNKSEHRKFKKALATLLYLLEYIIILPFIVFFWFAVLAIIILLASQEQTAIQVLMLTGAVVASVRIVSYYDEELSKDIAKLLPLTLLAVFITKSSFFNFDSVLDGLTQLPSFFTNVFYFLIFIIGLEIVLRIITLIFTRDPLEDLWQES